MVDQKRSSSPSDYERKQAQLRAAYEEKQLDIDAREKYLIRAYGDEFERIAEIRGVQDQEIREVAAEFLARDLAERGTTRPELMDHQDYLRVADQAISKAYKWEDRQRELDAQNDSLEPSEATPEKPSAHLIEPATPAREPEQDPRQQPAEALEHQAEATPVHFPAQDHGQRPIGRYDEMTQQHAEIVAKNSPQEQGQEQAEEKQLKFSEDRQQHSPEIVAQAETQQHGEPGEKQLRFSEDRDPRDNSQGHNEERTDAKQAEHEESGEKKLAFFEDRNPSQSHEMEH
jgi:hypothetical protein